MASTTTLLAVHEVDGGDLILVDAGGNQHRVRNGPELWIAVKQILANPELPEVETRAPSDLEDMVTMFVESQMPPGLERLARPAVVGLIEGLRNLSSRRYSAPR